MSRILLPCSFLSSSRTFVFLLLLLQVYAAKRPVWNVAHKVNLVKDIEPALNRGANSIQFNIIFSNQGVPLLVQHQDYPYCHCNRTCFTSEEIPTFLNKLRQLTDPRDPKFRKELTLIIVYNNLETLNTQNLVYMAGRNMAKTFEDNYWKKGGKANVLLVIPATKYRDFFQGIRTSPNFPERKEKIGFDVASGDHANDEPIQIIGNMYRQLNIPAAHAWLSNSVTRCLDIHGQCICQGIDNGIARLRQAVNVRDGPNPYMVKVCAWVLDQKPIIRSVFRLKVDVVMTDYPEMVVAVLQEPEFASKFKIADLTDTPWERYKGN